MVYVITLVKYIWLTKIRRGERLILAYFKNNVQCVIRDIEESTNRKPSRDAGELTFLIREVSHTVMHIV